MSILAFLGVGAMGEAIARGLVASGYDPKSLVLYSPTQARIQALADSMGARAASSPLEAIEGAETVLLGVKPQMVEKALAPLRDAIAPSQTLVSVAAGVSTQRLEACFSQEVPVVRVMPNTPSLVGAGAAGLAPGKFAGAAHMARAMQLFEAIGVAVATEEKLLDAVTGLSGSGPAYAFIFIEALADGGVRAGLPRAVAQKLAAQTLLGAAKMVLETGDHPGLLKDRVASPGGTTIAGLHALEQGGLRGLVMDAVMASANRARELG